MDRIQARVLPIVGVSCLLGTGWLLLASAGDAAESRLAFPFLFLLLTIVLAVTLGLATRGRPSVLRLGSLSAVTLLFAAAIGAVAVSGDGAGQGERRAAVARLDEARSALRDLEPALQRTAARILARLEAEPIDPDDGGEPFRRVADWPRIWREEFDLGDLIPLEAVIWHGDRRLAWTSRAEPLPAEFAPPPEAGVVRPLGASRLARDRDGGLLQALPMRDGMIGVELQLRFGVDALQERWPAVVQEITPARAVTPLNGAAGGAIPEALLLDEISQLTYRVELAAGAAGAPGAGSDGAALRWLLAASLLWLPVAAIAGVCFAGRFGLLLGLWTGRALLATVGFFRLLGPAWPGLSFPARPASAASLIDPAYFATPLWHGFFASTADAVLTVALGALTAWAVLRYGGALEATGPDDARRSPSAAAALVLGLVVGAVLPVLRIFTSLVAENSNARLIGDGVSLSLLSFWVLHVVLLLAGLTLLALAALPLRRCGLPSRDSFGRWAAGSAAAAAGAALASAPAGSLEPAQRLLLGLFGAGVFWIVPALRARPRFLRRLAWPCLLLAVVCWNYASLRTVYSRAERAWLERKGDLITESAEDWMLYLLEDTLSGMRDAEGRLDRPRGRQSELWNDESAYRLWEQSALKDLGYACLVELIDAAGDEESLFATGQMRDFEFRVAGRTAWTDADGAPVGEDWVTAFQTEERIFPDGRESVLAGEIRRRGGRGSIRVEIPVKSDRIGTLEADLAGRVRPVPGQYRPRAEVDRPVLLLRGDADGWRTAGVHGFPLPQEDAAVAELRSGVRDWAEIRTAGGRWLCRWEHLPTDWKEGPEDGFLLGLAVPGFRDVLLDFSRLLLLDLALFVALLMAVRGPRAVFVRLLDRPAAPDAEETAGDPWRPGFQERFLAGYLLLGLVLLAVVGGSVDRVGQNRIGGEARSQTRAGLSLAVQQMRSLLVEQARSLAGSEYIADLLLGQLAGQRPAGPLELRQGMVFAGDGTLLLDETLSGLTTAEAAGLLAAGRGAPFMLVRQESDLYVATVIPIDLEDVWEAARGDEAVSVEESGPTDGFFLYRQRFEEGLLAGLADLARGEATLRVSGLPVLSSHPEGLFSGREPLLADPVMMGALRDHPTGPTVFAAAGRAFAYTGCQPLPAFGYAPDGRFLPDLQPAVLALAFPDREREFVAQRRATVLFLAGLANLILLTALVLAVVLSWNIFRPLRLLLAATRSLARGDFEAPLPEAGGDEVGRLAGAFGLMRSELHTARDRLAAREQFLATVLDRVTVGVAVLDRDGEPVTLNRAGRRILEEFDPGRESGRAAKLLERFRAEAGDAAQWSGEIRSADGQRTLRGALAPLDLPNGRTDTMLVFEDITEFLRTKMMAINAELARQVAHEIKNPLTPIQLQIQLLEQAWRDEHPRLDTIVRDSVRRVLEQVDLLRTIASEFSLLGRPGDLEIEALDLGNLVRRTIDSYGGAADPEGGAPRISLPEGAGPRVLGHEDSLQKILGNLMQNSLDAAHQGQPARIDVSWREADGKAVLVWRDHGQGIADEVADRLFDPYFSTKSSGTGLGLAICRNLADRMGGGISLGAPADGAGAVAELTLPLASEGNERP